jgi:hypothetical protein
MKNTNNMKRFALCGLTGLLLTRTVCAQDLKTSQVPATVREALMKKYPSATKVGWEKEKGNYEANWGGRSKEDSSVVFTPEAVFVEIVVAIPVAELPAGVAAYVKQHYPSANIKEAGRVVDAAGVVSFEAEIKGKDLIFDEKGNFVKVD